MNPKYFDHTNFKSEPWKNGQGETLELFRLGNPGDPQNFFFRLSIATIKISGPFSQYPGIDRHLILIEGGQILLKRENGQTSRLGLYELCSFHGEEVITSGITSKCRDFNVMTNRSWGKSETSVVKINQGNKLIIPGNSFLYQLEGTLRYTGNEAQRKLWQVDKSIEIESVTDSTSILITNYLS